MKNTKELIEGVDFEFLYHFIFYEYINLKTGEIFHTEEPIHKGAKIIEFMGNEMDAALNEAKNILK